MQAQLNLAPSDFYSGIPEFVNATPLYHDLDVTIVGGNKGFYSSEPGPKSTYAKFSSLTRFDVPKKGEVTILLPVHVQGNNEIPILFMVQVDKSMVMPMISTPISSGSPETINLNLAKGHHSLRVQYSEYAVPKVQIEGRKSLCYGLGGGALSTIQIAFHYNQSTVFGLPEITNYPFQVGYKGAFWKTTNFYPPTNQSIFFKFYDLPSIK